MSDTPRTDRLLTAILDAHGFVHKHNCPPQWVMFARELERELKAANERIKWLEEEVNDLKGINAAMAMDAAMYEYRGERIKRLEEVGNTLVWYFCPRETGDLSYLQSVALKQWNAAKEAKT